MEVAVLSLESLTSPSWHSQLLGPAQLIQEGFFSSITMYCNSCQSKKTKKHPIRHSKTESLQLLEVTWTSTGYWHTHTNF